MSNLKNFSNIKKFLQSSDFNTVSETLGNLVYSNNTFDNNLVQFSNNSQDLNQDKQVYLIK